MKRYRHDLSNTRLTSFDMGKLIVTRAEPVIAGTSVIGGIGDTAIGNTVTISNGLVKYEAIGGDGYGATGNSVVINDGTIGSDDYFAMVAGGRGVKVENTTKEIENLNLSSLEIEKVIEEKNKNINN